MPAPKPPVKKPTTAKSFFDDVKSEAHNLKKTFLDYASNWQKFKNIVGNNFQLGLDHLNRGNYQDAVLRFKFVLWLDPNFKEAWFHLGCAQLAMGNTAAAKDSLAKALKNDPSNGEARYMLAITLGKAMPKSELPKSIPIELVRQQFNDLASTYTIDQVGTFKYEGHTQLANAVRAVLTPGRSDHIILELAVGSGLCGSLLRDVASHITGVDISAKMLAEAAKVTDDRGNKLYDALIDREAVDFITDGPDSSYDIIIAAGLIGYLGDPQAFFEQSARLLKSGGVLAFTADKFESTGYQFDPLRGRFAFSPFFLADMATRFGLSEVKTREANIYPESQGLLCVYRK